MTRTPGSCFAAQFKQNYERIFCHQFNYRTRQLENSTYEHLSRAPSIPQLNAFLNPLPFSRRSELRRHNMDRILARYSTSMQPRGSSAGSLVR
mmetsp:Transcript_41277/g.86201  ORF Transcript_41277/g.86201 Transcript_41277/m.86201 type:complete len:93 (+) Transcript_41277:3947-4225(+)